MMLITGASDELLALGGREDGTHRPDWVGRVGIRLTHVVGLGFRWGGWSPSQEGSVRTCLPCSRPAPSLQRHGFPGLLEVGCRLGHACS